MNGVQGTGRTFLDLQEEDFSSLQPADLAPFGNMENILANYRSLECSVCRRHFGYVHRMDSRIILCAAPCLTVASNKLKNITLGKPPTVFTKPLQQARLVESANALVKKPAIVGTAQKDINALPSVIHAECMEAVTQQSNRDKGIDKGFRNGYSNGDCSNRGPEKRVDQDLSSKASDASVQDSPRAKLPAVEQVRKTNGKGKSDEQNVIESSNLRIDVQKPSSSTVKKDVTPSKPKIWTNKDFKVSPNLKDGARVYPSFFTTPSTFILRAEDDESKVQEMQNEIQEYCGTSPQMARMPSTDEVVFALYGDTFYRGVVVGLKTEEATIQIEFFDDGDSTCVKLADCREASDSIMKKHPVSYGVIFECDMNVRCPDAYEPSEELQKLIQDVSILKIITEGNGRIRGSLEIPSLPGKTVNQLLTQEIAIYSGHQNNNANVVSQEVRERKQPVAGENGSTKSRSVDQTMEKRRQTRPTFLSVPLSENVKKGARVHINYIGDYRRMSISSVDDDDNFALLQEQIAEYIPKAPEVGAELVQDDLVLAPYKGGETFYRASVSGLCVDEAGVHVRFVDYGDDAILPVKVLRELNDTIANHPIYGLEWRMAGLPRRFKSGFVVPELNNVHQGVIEVTKQNMDYWKGLLRLDNGKTWNEVVLSKLEAKGKRH